MQISSKIYKWSVFLETVFSAFWEIDWLTDFMKHWNVLFERFRQLMLWELVCLIELILLNLPSSLHLISYLKLYMRNIFLPLNKTVYWNWYFELSWRHKDMFVGLLAAQKHISVENGTCYQQPLVFMAQEQGATFLLIQHG